MTKTSSLKAEIREHTGSSAAAQVRRQGRIPAIVYGHKEEPAAISLDAHDFVEALHHGSRLLEIKIGRRSEKAIVKDLQYDHLGRKIIHADLVRVDVTEQVVVTVPIELKGTAQGTHHGGLLEEHADHLEVQCLPTQIPEAIVVPVREVEVGDSIHAGDVELPEGVTLVSPADTLLVACHAMAVAKTTEELEEEAPVAPEVIGRAKEGEEGAEEKSS
ncbi:MAG: 50S ribosomal protein L25 [Sedimentisphaerales bacterium]|nr:50S ribosomal protein L25 [Sedimentisphaerales bacterium]